MNERILNHEAIGGESAPGNWLYVLHGIFGAGRNWSTVARRFVGARAGWGAVLLDLRQHGESQGFAPPHTLDAAASDITALIGATGRPCRAMLGHSFGGKVALRWTRDAPTGLEQVWVVDSSPAAGEPRGSAWQMLTVLKSIPSEFVSRDDAITALTERAVAPPVAHWMSTNLQRSGERLRWRFDTDAIEALMLDFFQTDLWDVVEQPPAGVDVHFVKATESSVLSGEVLERVERIASGGRVHVHRVDGGHWINADNPDAVVELLVANANVAP